MDPVVVCPYFPTAERNSASEVHEYAYKCDALYYNFKKVQTYSDGITHTPDEDFGTTASRLHKSYFQPIADSYDQELDQYSDGSQVDDDGHLYET